MKIKSNTDQGANSALPHIKTIDSRSAPRDQPPLVTIQAQQALVLANKYPHLAKFSHRVFFYSERHYETLEAREHKQVLLF